MPWLSVITNSPWTFNITNDTIKYDKVSTSDNRVRKNIEIVRFIPVTFSFIELSIWRKYLFVALSLLSYMYTIRNMNVCQALNYLQQQPHTTDNVQNEVCWIIRQHMYDANVCDLRLKLNTISLFDLIVCISKYDRESQYVCYFFGHIKVHLWEIWNPPSLSICLISLIIIYTCYVVCHD